MKKIGLIDYYISEWHANNYPAFFEKVCNETGQDFKISYAWAEENVSPKDNRTTDEWCEAFGVEKCDTIQELCDKSDCIIILAPSDPEKHLPYVKEAFPCGKLIYVDKTFAVDKNDCKEIFDIAQKYNTKFFSTSALRYAEELDEFMGEKKLFVTGGGGNLPEYIIHQIEMIVKTIGLGATKVKLTTVDEVSTVEIAYDDDRQAEMRYWKKAPFTIGKLGDEEGVKVTSNYFHILMGKILHFFDTEEVDFDSNQTIEVMKIRGGVLKALENQGEWVSL